MLGQLIQVAISDEHGIEHALPAMHHVVVHVDEHERRLRHNATQLAGEERAKVCARTGVHGGQQPLGNLQGPKA